jgi:hypothetical protein
MNGDGAMVTSGSPGGFEQGRICTTGSGRVNVCRNRLAVGGAAL